MPCPGRQALVHTVLVLAATGSLPPHRCGACIDTTLKVLLAGRNLDRAIAAADAMQLPPERAVAIDTLDVNLARTLSGLQVNILINTAGPFQVRLHGRTCRDRSRLPLRRPGRRRQFCRRNRFSRCLSSGAGVTVISGASSVPALSSAVVDRYRAKFQRLDSIHVGISSGARAPGWRR